MLNQKIFAMSKDEIKLKAQKKIIEKELRTQNNLLVVSANLENVMKAEWLLASNGFVKNHVEYTYI